MKGARKKAVFVYAAIQTTKKKNRRQLWTHPINNSRFLQGEFYTLYEDLKADNGKFFNYFRMTYSTFQELLARVTDGIKQQDTNMRPAIPPEEAVALSIRYLASGCSLTDLHYRYRVGISTASKVVRRVCCALWDMMKVECFPQLDEEEWLKIAAGFQQHAHFPHCIGAVDGKRVRVTRPEHSGSMYFNNKAYFSVVLLAVADTDYCFRYVDVGSYGKHADSTIFQESNLFKQIQENVLKLPKPQRLSDWNEVLPYAFVGNEAFGLSINLLRPYSGHNLTNDKKLFNYRLSRARRYVGWAFGILSNKWGIFHRPMNVNVDFAIDIAKACCVLHNFVRQREKVNFADILEVNGFEDVDHSGQVWQGGRYAKENRGKFCTYFNNEAGKLPRQ
ncbi:uncharacterized protein LOC143033253 [Oratosquilla oratoria]|uniref:uncharacterized protein LOC143033253 n=1 Tax=Oratosquilla oratoria TaxID=337810 RepID=UPI003F75B43D